ncbi:MAG: AAA family ATPase [Candidatus Omnitrophota bacterium]
MDWKKTKFLLKLYLKLYWIRVIVVTLICALAISFVFLLTLGLKAWNEVESYLRQSQLAMFPLQLYMQLIMSIMFGMFYTYMWYWLMFKKGAGSFTHVTKKAVSGKDIQITWADVIGMDEAKQEALEIVNLIKDRAELQRIGGQILRGLLLQGPPGCGKTYLAKAIATAADIPFISMSGSEFVEMFVGVGAGRIRSLFKRARLLSEFKGGCIIFIDELDALGAARSMDSGFGGTTEHNQTLNQLLVEMDGLKEKDSNIIIIGATNAPMHFLDRALLRAGRFDRKIYVDKPNLEDREKLFQYYLKKIQFDPNEIKIERLARITIGYSPADVANLVREAALIAVRHKKQIVSMKEMDDARERIELGVKRRIRLTPKEKLHTAYHEAGHAIITYLMVPFQDVFKITITPRGDTGGVTWTPEREEIFVHNKNHFLGYIRSCLGSYAAELLKLGFTTGGVGGDFTTAYLIAHDMVWRWGMGKSGLIGNFHAVSNLRTVSEETKSRLDNDVQDILQSCLKEVTEVLKQEDALLERLTQELVSKEELNYDEIEAIFKEFDKHRAQ